MLHKLFDILMHLFIQNIIIYRNERENLLLVALNRHRVKCMNSEPHGDRISFELSFKM